MTMKNFKHTSGRSLAEVSKAVLKAKGKTAVIAGGTDLLGALKDRIHGESPELVIDLKTIPALRYVREDKKGLRIGTLTTLQEIATNKAVLESYGVLAEAARSVASPQLRNMGTIGGNICQETRCWYYRAPNNQFHCLRKGGTKCGALLGDNRYHSIFGGTKSADPGCKTTCPGHIDIPGYMSKVRAGGPKAMSEAAAILLENNPIPAMTGRICPHLCESKCNRNGFDEPVSIRGVERAVGDYALEHASTLMKAPSKNSKKSVAIVGSGPAGLSAAFYLRREGHQVTIFDRMPEAGGMLRYLIPGFRLPKDLVKKQIKAFEKMGVKFKLGVEIGAKAKKAQKKSVTSSVTLSELRKKFDSVFLASGAWREKSLEMENSHLLVSGMDFLTKCEMGTATWKPERVLVIGGGNVAIDVAMSAKHLGAKHVTMACLETRATMPAYPEEIAEALELGVKILPSFGPHQILQKNGKITGMEMLRCTSVLDANRRFRPTFDPNQKQAIEADLVIFAIGQSTDLSYADKSLKTERGLIVVNPETGKTSLPGVFAGGDVSIGPATVIEAIGAGRKTALAINAEFGSRTTKKSKAVACASEGQCLDIHPVCQTKCARMAPMPKTAELTAIEREVERCLNCGCIAVNASDIAPALIALDANIKTTHRLLSSEEFFNASQLKTTVLELGEFVEEIVIPASKAAAPGRYQKFRIRNSIDFPIVSLASKLPKVGGKFKGTRIVFGAVAPVPLRMRMVEEFLEGKAATEEVAKVAGDIAVKDAQPLAKNGFKIQIVRELLRKAILG